MSALDALHAPATVEEALRLLASEETRCLAGGASLVAMMNAGVIEPAQLVSLAGIAELSGIRALPDGAFRIGAMTRHRETAAEVRLNGDLAVVREAAASIANATVRNMGTMGGSISLSDPAADYPPALVACGARVEIAAPSGRRTIPATEFFVDWYTTALSPGELVTAILLPAASAGLGRYEKLARVAGDFAIVSIALSVAWRDGACSRAGIAIGGCGPRPVHLAEANELLAGAGLSDHAAREAGALLARAADPVDDVRASAEYRRMVIPRMVVRAVAQARGSLRGTE
jgi:aerobic carbon-monoxide dehydrogenase medium subunit